MEMEVREIALDAISVSEFNVRKDLKAGTEDAGIQDLANSIRENGLNSPVIVRTAPEGRYELIVGQRRFLACRRLGMATIPATIRDDLDDASASVISLIENVQRADMNPMDKARAFQTIHSQYGSDKIVSRKTGVSVPTIRRYAKLLKLAPSIQDKLTTSSGSAGVETLSALADNFAEEDQEYVLGEISGFDQRAQREIIKRSGGDINKIQSLVEQALEGAFKVHMCRDGLCFRMSDEEKARVKMRLGEDPGSFQRDLWG